MRLVHRGEDLESDPPLFNVVQERPRTNAVIKVVPYVLSEKHRGLLRQGRFLEGKAVLCRVQPYLQLLQLLLVARQGQGRVLNGKHLHDHQPLPVLGSGDLEEAGAPQALVVFEVVDVREVAVHREDLRGGDASQLVPHGAASPGRRHRTGALPRQPAGKHSACFTPAA